MTRRYSTPEPRAVEDAGIRNRDGNEGPSITVRWLVGPTRLRRPEPVPLVALQRSVCFAVAVASLLAGCARRPPADTEDTAPPTVSVSQPIERLVTDYVDFVGRTESPFSLEVRSRVTGYLVKMPFTEGSPVRAGDVLFEIDERPYKAELDQAKAGLEQAQAALVKTQAFLDIGLETQKLSPGAVSQQEIVQRRGSRDQAAAAVKSAEATLVKCQLNYDWCKVTSQIDGRVSRYNLTLGNLATQDTSLLTTVVSEDPLHAYFDVDERTVLRIVRHLLPNKVDPIPAKQVPVLMGLADEDGFPHTGYVDFANNVVNAATATVTVRGVFANPASASGRRLMKPGMFVRIRLPIGKPRPALVVSEKALGTDQGQKYLFVVDAQNLVQYRRVTVGPLQSDGLRVIEEGLQPGEWVLVSGLQLVRPQLEVHPERTAMVSDTEGGTGKADSRMPQGEGDKPATSHAPTSAAPRPQEPPAADRPPPTSSDRS
jgi:multidrug efflux system membrane fusion protein